MSPPTLLEERPSTLVVDPRFEERRAAVARSESRRRRHRYAVVAAVVAGLLGLFGLSRSPLVDLDGITVLGWENAGREEIVAASGLTGEEQLADIDTGVVARRVEALVPWVAQATVSRSWPSTVRIAVVERRAVAQVQGSGGGWYLLDMEGRLVSETTGPRPELTTVEGTVPGARPGAFLNDRVAASMGVLAEMSPALASHMKGVRFVDGGELELLLRPWGSVAFGPIDQVPTKLLATEAVLARVDPTCLAAIDVRVARRPLVRRDPGCSWSS